MLRGRNNRDNVPKNILPEFRKAVREMQPETIQKGKLLEKIFTVLRTLDIDKFLDIFVPRQGVEKDTDSNWNEGKGGIAGGLEEWGLMQVTIKKERDFRKWSYGRAFQKRETAKLLLGVLQRSAQKEPDAWKDYVGRGTFADMLSSVETECSFIVAELGSHKVRLSIRNTRAELEMIELYERDRIVWRLIKDWFDDEKAVRPDYSKAKAKE